MNILVPFRRLHFALAGLLLSALATMGQTIEIARTIGPTQFDLISIPLLTASNNQFAVMTTNAPNFSSAYFFDAPTTNFISAQKSGKGLWSAEAANRIILPGESFFLKSSPFADCEVTIQGMTPPSPVTHQIYERWSALGYPYPEDIQWTHTTLASNLPIGTLVYFWSRNAQQFQTFLKGPPAKGGWGTAATKFVIHPGDGFIVRQPPGSTPFIWTE